MSAGTARAALAREGGGEVDGAGSEAVVSQSGAKARGSSITSVEAEPAALGRWWVMVNGSERC